MPLDHRLIGHRFGPHRFEYRAKDAALYALACGASIDELDLVLGSRGPKVLPTFSVVFVFSAIQEAIAAVGGNLLMLVHGGQRCTVSRPLSSEAEVSTTATLEALYDKGSGALAVYRTSTVDDRDKPLAETEWQIFYRGEGGFGGERGPDTTVADAPEDQPVSSSLTLTTSSVAAVLYHWASGDPNPIHLEPSIAEQVGFPKPILQGLCTLGHAARALIDRHAGGDPARLRSIEGRFTKPVFPGQPLTIDAWTSRPDSVRFRVTADAVPVITRGRALIQAA